MSDTETAPVPASSVAEDKGNLKRSIQMRMFADKVTHKRVAFADKSETLGQIIGQIWDVKERMGTLPSGEQKMSLLAYGEFEAVVYATGEVSEAGAAYLPQYYLETIKSMLDKGLEAVNVAIEVVLVPTGKNIPTAYEVKNLIRRRPDNALNRIKEELAKAGRLRLPAPEKTQALAIEHEITEVPVEDTVVEEAEVETAPAKGAKKVA